MVELKLASSCIQLLLLLLPVLVLTWGSRDGRQTATDLSIEERMADLEKIVVRQNGLLQQQAEKIATQEVLFRTQLSELTSTVNRQNKKLFRQDKRIRQLTQFMKQTHANKSDMNSDGGYEYISANYVPSYDHKNGDQTILATVTPANNDELMASLSHGVLPRSDDTDPLETVVNQMGQQITAMNANIQSLLNVNTEQDQKIQHAQASTFVHWGSSRCPGDSEIVYSGVIGGSYYTHVGAAINYLCLTMSPVLSNHAIPSLSARLYGAEYETYDPKDDSDAVCSVCRSRYTTTIMIPATTVCSEGWQRQYSGFLMANYYDYAAGSEYICVNSTMEVRPGSSQSLDGKLLYFTVTHCGSLPCSPYTNDKIVTCVVCSL